MMNINIIAVGRLKEKYLTDGCEEYKKRLTSMCRLKITEVEEYRLGDSPSEAQIEICIEKEGRKILEKIPKGSVVIPMCIEGRQMKSEDFSGKLSQMAVRGVSEVSFVIGGSRGLWQGIKDMGEMKMSMSEMTFPHQLARLMLLEQIYRAFSIMAGTKYHK